MEWKTSDTFVDYEDALAFQEARVRAIQKGGEECIWLLQHPPLYTAGTSAKESDYLGVHDFPVYLTGRGGEYTYHGPGQRIAYVMLDLKEQHGDQPDLRRFVWQLEEWIIRTLDTFGVKGERREGRVGIWVAEDTTGAENKIAAIGIRIKKWVTFHGIAINVNTDLTHFNGIVPCGIHEHGVCSLHSLGINVSMEEVDSALKACFEDVF